jgi:hypothetical protein
MQLMFCKIMVVLAVLLMSCSAVRQVRPLEKGEQAVSLSLGGPVTKYLGTAYAPFPLLGVGYAYGFNHKFNFQSGLQLTQAVFGVLQLDAGVDWRPWPASKLLPGAIISPRLFFSADINDFTAESMRLYPDLDITAYWEPWKYKYIYTGITNWFEFASTRSDGLEQKHHWLITPFLGTNLGNNKYQFQFEFRVYTPNLSNLGRGAKNIGFGEYGILGFFIGGSYTFGGAK